MYDEVACNSDIPHSSCLCEVCKNAPLLAKVINSSLKSSDILSPTAHELAETYTHAIRGLHAWKLSGIFKTRTIAI